MMPILTLISLVTNYTKWVVMVLATNFIICNGLLERESYPLSGWECPLILINYCLIVLDVLIYIMHVYISLYICLLCLPLFRRITSG